MSADKTARDLFVIVAGTDPASCRGGIAHSLPGYLHALESANVPHCFIVTHHPERFIDKWRHWLTAFYRISAQARQAKHLGLLPVVYLHVGGGYPSLFRKSLLAAYLRAKGLPVLAQLHGLEVANYLGSKRWEPLFLIAMKPVCGIGVLTPWWRRLLERHGFRCPLFVIPNPLPPQLELRARQPLQLRSPDGHIQLLCMTRLEKGKGVRLAIDCLASLPTSYRLSIAGSGSLEPALRKRVRCLGLSDRVQFYGWVSGEEKDGLFQQCDIFLLPTRLDSFGMGLVEAMAWGRPIIALKWQAIEDVVLDGTTGLLVDSDNPETVGKAVLSLDRKKRLELGREGKKWVRKRFGASSIGRTLKEAFTEIAQRQ